MGGGGGCGDLCRDRRGGQDEGGVDSWCISVPCTEVSTFRPLGRKKSRFKETKEFLTREGRVF